MATQITADDIITQLARTTSVNEAYESLSKLPKNLLRQVLDLQGVDATEFGSVTTIIREILRQHFGDEVNEGIARPYNPPKLEQQPSAEWETELIASDPEMTEAELMVHTRNPEEPASAGYVADIQPEENLIDQDNCAHEDISWHGSRGECQACGKGIAPLENTPARSYFSQARDIAAVFGTNYARRLQSKEKNSDAWYAAYDATTEASLELAKLMGSLPSVYHALILEHALCAVADSFQANYHK